ncbi:uncharacterized protein LOC116792798 isoform X2 [Chiroxiphia lanceolata]|uniref:uncharacterized protein LOC116792798 isoform X2 n=1 Tax=Chiroxiphia lanceolata TaxID=296741 RepID=UPI0013CEB8D6|nr:uncharacterized protein LOC116792798 isoform X2 [Chiroxiphia lanceolata]
MKCHTRLGLSPWYWPHMMGTVPQCSQSGHIPGHRQSHVLVPRATTVFTGAGGGPVPQLPLEQQQLQDHSEVRRPWRCPHDEPPRPGELPPADPASPRLAVPPALALAGLLGSSGTSPSGIVAKHGKNHLLRTRGPAKVLRRKGGMDVAALQQRIRAAMEQVVEYDAITCNCIHFALALLGLGQLAGAMVSPALQ